MLKDVVPASASTGIQSVEVGVPLLKALAQGGGPMSLSALAAATGMPRGKAHKYLASFVRTGLVVQDGYGGLYDLGPFALDLGLAAMRRLDAMDLAQEALDGLRDELGLTISYCVWANRGPALVRWAATPQTSPNERLGTVFPVLASFVGQVFGAYLDRRHTQAMIEAELADSDGLAAKIGITSRERADALLDTVREHRMAAGDSLVLPAMSVLAAPVFDLSNTITAAMAVVGPRGHVDLSLGGPVAQALTRSSQSLSRRMGATRQS